MANEEARYREILDQTPTPVMTIDRDFQITFMNQAGCGLVGKELEELLGLPCHEVMNTGHCRTEKCRLAQAMKTGKSHSGRTQAVVGGQELPIEYTGAPLRNDQGKIVGGLEFILDISERVAQEEKERELQRSITEMSTPVLNLAEGVLAMPLIGTLDSQRTQQAMEQALTQLSEEKASVLIVDITGVPVIDTMVANHLIRMVSAAKLMGAESILTGISPHTARTIVHLGIDLSGLNTRATLAQGLSLALELVGHGRRSS